ncbi:MAG TPA: hypothetical protein VJ279_02205 [Hanamia sp.]|nr:hypothetical protein [Hanamia sp.]
MHTHLFDDNKIDQVLKPAVINSDTLTAAIDMKGYQDLLAIVHVGLSADTLNSTNKIYLELQHSDTDGDYVACADADITNPVTGAETGTFALIDAASEDEKAYFTGYKGTKRYLKVNINFEGTHTTGTPIGVTTLKGLANAMPVNTTNNT